MSTIKAEKLQSLGSKLNFLTGTTPTQRLTIDENGFIGIGTTTPSQKLSVEGGLIRVDNLGASPQTTLILAAQGSNLQVTHDGSPICGFLNSGTGYGGFEFKGNLGTTLRMDGTGNVGIGTTTPEAQLEIVSSQTALRIIVGTTGDVGLRVYEDLDTAGFLRCRPLTSTQKGFVFSNSGDTSILSIDTLLNRVGIGTATPAVALDVAGAGKFSESVTIGTAAFAAPSGTAPIFGARAWGLANWSGTAISLGNAGNIASVVRLTGTGLTDHVTFTFTTPMPNENYVVVCGSQRLSGGSSRTFISTPIKTANSFTIVAQAADGAMIFDTQTDRLTTINVAVFC
jgi:hypothetical protein